MAHLKGIGIRNFRIFEKETYFDFTNINILVGPNSSGKSSLLKLLLLLQANENLKDLDLSKGSHNLGEFKTLINKSSKEKELVIKFPITLFEINVELFVELVYKQRDNNTGVLSNLKIFDKSDNEEIYNWLNKEINFDHLLKYFKLYIKYITKNPKMIGGIYNSPKPIDFSNFSSELPDDSYGLKVKLNDTKDGLTNENLLEFTEFDFSRTIFEYDKILNLSTENEMSFLKSQFNLPCSVAFLDATFPDDKGNLGRLINWLYIIDRKQNDNKNSEFLKLVELRQIKPTKNSRLFFNFISNIFCSGISKILNIGIPEILNLNNFEYINVIKGVQSRFKVLQDSNDSFTDLLKEYSSIKDGSDKYKQRKLDEAFLNDWLNKFKIGKSFDAKRQEVKIIFPMIKIERDEMNLADLGYGSNQILYILLKILNVAMKHCEIDEEGFPRYKPSILFMEEPEANLHPDFQSRLSDLFVDASNKFNIQFIIETHSEYLIRRLKLLTADYKKEDIPELKPEDSVIYYFNHPDEVAKGAEQVKEIHILNDGSLTDDFGSGFFDEADKIALELYNLQRKKTMRN
jgi:predicted ATPase